MLAYIMTSTPYHTHVHHAAGTEDCVIYFHYAVLLLKFKKKIDHVIGATSSPYAGLCSIGNSFLASLVASYAVHLFIFILPSNTAKISLKLLIYSSLYFKSLVMTFPFFIRWVLFQVHFCDLISRTPFHFDSLNILLSCII